MLLAISPLDGRYHEKIKILSAYFSEFALIKYRVFVEIEYFIYLDETLELPFTLSDAERKFLKSVTQQFSLEDGKRIKEIEAVTKHDVKAVEYFIKEKMVANGMEKMQEFIHFGLTSQDINNTATPLLLKQFNKEVFLPKLNLLLEKVIQLGIQWKQIPMMARTHGQVATPTSVGKEFLVFAERLEKQIDHLAAYKYYGKFGGATGNFNAHKIAYPQIDWPIWADQFVNQKLGIERQYYTTQIAHYDEWAEWFQILIRINTILIDFCRDIWTYISMDYFKQRVKEGEVGSSAMPHKVNPIDFENAEGNLGMSVAVASFLAEKLPISRLQRDLTDSTILRNIGVPIGHSFLAIDSFLNGLQKLIINETKIKSDLDSQWIILAEAIQTVLRREGYANPYEQLKELTRGKDNITKKELHEYINSLAIDQTVKNILLRLTPDNYTGYSTLSS